MVENGGQKPNDVPVVAAGTVVDHFKVLRLVARGGMGQVYLARDIRLGRKVALKFIHREDMDQDRAKERFLGEARATARFNHPNIVAIYHVGEHDGSPYLALEYLEGQDLRTRMQQERLSIREVQRVGLSVAEALKEAHGHGLMHRDLKPENVLIPKDGRIRVLDFGLAVEVRRQRPVPLTDVELFTDTIDEMVVRDDDGATLRVIYGSPAYLAPERWSAAQSTGAVDIWGLGVILYELICGRRPFEANTAFHLREQICGPEPVRVKERYGEIPPEFVGLIERCLNKNPLERPSASEVVRGLKQMLAESSPLLPAEQSPFRGLVPFAEEHAGLFFGREAETAAFVERIRQAPVLPVVGPSGAGKSSFVRAGVIPRLKEQGNWTVLLTRPGVSPFEALAARITAAEHVAGGVTVPTVIDRIDSTDPGEERAESGAESSVESVESGESEDRPSEDEPPAVDEGVSPAPDREAMPTEVMPMTSRDRPRAGSEKKWIDVGSGFSRVARKYRERVFRLSQELLKSPWLLSLRLQQLAEKTESRVLLFVDQLEELYTLTEDEPIRRRFMEAVCLAADDPQEPVRVVFTVRDDFLGRVAEGPEVRDALSHVTVIRSPGPEALRDTVVKPVEAVGYGFDDPELVDEMISDVWGAPACLPLLQFTAQLMWERRDKTNGRLLRSAYQSMGGVGGALADHADAVLQGMSPSEVRLARQILLRLVTAEGTRRILSQQDALEGLGPEADGVLDRLVGARLVTATKGRTGQDAGGEEAEVELVHESLVTAWSTLERWISESQEEMVFLAETRQAAELWQKRGRRDDEVWQSEALHEARRKLERCTGKVPGSVKEFIQAGIVKEARTVSARRVRRAFVTIALAAVALVSVAAALAFREKEREARTQKRRADVQRNKADSRSAEAQREGARAALMRGELLEARAKLRGSLETRDSLLARALWWRLSRNALAWKKDLGVLIIYTVAYSPDGSRLAVGSQDGSIYLLNSTTLRVRFLRGHRDQVLSVGFSADGKLLASGAWNGEVRLWNLEGGSSIVLSGHKDSVLGVSFSPDGKLLATGSFDTTVRIWDVKTGRRKKTFKAEAGRARGVAFSPDGRLLVSGHQDGAVRVWDVGTGRRRKVIKGHAGELFGVCYSKDGKLIASSSLDRTIRIWDAATGRKKHVLRGHTGPVWSVAFDPQGRYLASGSTDKTVRIWDVESGTQKKVIRGHAGASRGVSFSPDGKLLAYGFDKTVRVSNVAAIFSQNVERGHTSPSTGVYFSPDRRLLASCGLDNTIRIWDVASGVQKMVIRSSSPVEGLAFSPDGRNLAAIDLEGVVRIWDAATGARKKVYSGRARAGRRVSFSRDGKFLAAGGEDGAVRIWDTASGAITKLLKMHKGRTIGVSFSADGRLLASAGSDKTVGIWAVRTGKLKTLITGHAGRVWSVAFGPTGKLVASSGEDRTVRVWDWKKRKQVFVGRHRGRVYFIDFHPDGRRVGAPSSDGTARIWDIRTKTHITLRGHASEVNCVKFSRDGQLAATASDDGTVRIWDARTGRPVWRAPIMLGAPPEILTHQGWRRVDSSSSSSSSSRPPSSARKRHNQRWRRAVERHALHASLAADGAGLCVRTHRDRLEYWDVKADRLVFRRRVPKIRQVVAVPAGCVTMAKGTESGLNDVRLYDRTGRFNPLTSGATAIAVDRGDILVAAGKKILIFSSSGNLRSTHDADIGVTAMVRVGDWLALGNRDGNIELVSTVPGKSAPSFNFEDIPSNPVVRLLAGPKGTLIAGYANGLLGIWNLRNGTRLEHTRLHGPVSHMLLMGRKFYAATELGDHLVMDLSVFYEEYCDLLRRVWKKVPVVWEAGLPVVRPPPKTHRCPVR